jgi:hypothetical protein
MFDSHLAGLTLEIDTVGMRQHERETTSGFSRVTTEFALAGDGETGRGEDVTYETADHDALAEAGLPALTGEYTLETFSAHLESVSLFPEPPDRPVFRNYRRWGLESAALDLALRQADTDLGSGLELPYRPLRFVASTRLGEPPTTDRVDILREAVDDIGFKLDPTPAWDADLIDRLAATGGVEILDCKGQYEGTEVDVPADRALYERLFEAFPEALIEDPALTADTRGLFEDPSLRSRVSWDAPIHGIEDVESLPWEPAWLNIKPSRFGSLRSLLETLSYCADRGIRCYGGGQFELGVGRGQIQALASLFYPEGPNDVAPRRYNDPTATDGFPASPLSPPTEPAGFRWA